MILTWKSDICRSQALRAQRQRLSLMQLICKSLLLESRKSCRLQEMELPRQRKRVKMNMINMQSDSKADQESGRGLSAPILIQFLAR